MNDQDVQREAIEPLSRPLTKCRMCKSEDLALYLDLGHTPPADQFRTKEELVLPEVSYPLQVVLCQSCGLSQLNHIVDPRVLYQHDYPYESSTTKTGKIHWDEFAQKVVRRLALPKNSLVVDIGSNVGTLLESFRAEDMRVVGIDPAQNIVDKANAAGVTTYCDFYCMAVAEKVADAHDHASVIVGTNVFAHIDDLEHVMECNARLLGPEGVFIFESPYFQNLVDHLEYDTIYHEHLSYLSLAPVAKFVLRFGFEVFAVEESDIHGGSFRVYIGRQGNHAIDASVTEMLQREEERKLHDLEGLTVFAKRVADNREQLITLIEGLRKEGKKIVGVSAPAKGMTLLNYCGLTTRELAFLTERSTLKIGRFSPGGYIPILPDDALVNEGADYALLLAWNFAPEIIKNTRAFQEKGGKYIIPVPVPKIV
ncbi:MAG: putative methyltransferase [Parcubacteria bacterium C7867-001]|nr:MAG: putative methyltransferase [Parcubacteria bacterium C7867-001]